jgi:hypothetical protein
MCILNILFKDKYNSVIVNNNTCGYTSQQFYCNTVVACCTCIIETLKYHKDVNIFKIL